ncbi:hypothetical protein [Nostoc sp. UHCC 0251]|uniref:hypothetical protein n=1 Tax=Nostoc sp. UHCC 0251 TaxID=3110240 RepID=UPI002B21D605|nr:hypothetical protein [Nostoc sp. UHCC 0251]MEA5625000.1 hypothetical protein [Nostoc sp. UHCC 0251]
MKPNKIKDYWCWVPFFKRHLQGSSGNRKGAVAPQPTPDIMSGQRQAETLAKARSLPP